MREKTRPDRDRIDLIQKGITTLFVQFAVLVDFCDRIDLIQKGITTMVFCVTILARSARDRIDLIQKGITTSQKPSSHHRS